MAGGTAAAHGVAPRASTSLGVPPGNYNYQLCAVRHGQPPTGPRAFLTATSAPVALISSDDLVRVFEPSSLSGGLSRLEAEAGAVGKHADVTSLCPVPGAAGAGVITAGRDGMLRQWDPRTRLPNAKPTWERATKLQAAYLSLASCRHSHIWAAGTELTSSTATVEVWDSRQQGKPVASYTECHSDDISSLSFSIHAAGSLVSGSTDGLVNVYNPTFPADEDEALLQVVNHGSSIHQAGFLGEAGDTMLFALSHDETLAVYRREDAKEDPNENIEMPDAEPAGSDSADAGCIAAFGDVRERFDCNYVAEILPYAGGFCAVVGNFSEERMDLIDMPYTKLSDTPPGTEDRTRLRGAHGEEVVRAVHPYGGGDGGGLITAGEDGMVRFWPLEMSGAVAAGDGAAAEETRKPDKPELKTKRRRNETDEKERKHFKPY